jgi:hypothetical protein
MNRHDENKLIAGLLSGHEPQHVRVQSLEFGLAAVRQKARRRRSVRAISLACIPAIAGLLLLFTARRQPQPGAPVTPAPAPMAQAGSPVPPPIERIDDEELLALLPGRTVALIGPPGREQLFVFDPPDSAE